jgi:hypothetical protein
MSRLLVAIRTTAGLSQEEAGRRAAAYLERPLTQAKVSRAEAGRFPLSPIEAEAFARGCRAPAEDRRRLVQLARDLAATHITSRAALVRKPHTIQERIGRLERQSALIRGWQSEVVIGVLQTPAYTKASFGDPGSAWWQAREARQQMFAEPDRTWHLLMYEGALRWNLGDAVMIEQIEHLIGLSTRPNVQIGIVDQRMTKPMAQPSPFHLYGRRTAVVATASGTHFVTDPGELARYEEAFDQLDGLALYDDQAREALRRIADDYRRLS